MTYVTITKEQEIEVRVYEVTTQSGRELSFDVDVDCDGDLNITVEDFDVFDETSVCEWLFDGHNMQTTIDEACKTGRLMALEMLVESLKNEFLTPDEQNKLKQILTKG